MSGEVTHDVIIDKTDPYVRAERCNNSESTLEFRLPLNGDRILRNSDRDRRRETKTKKSN